MKLITSLLLLLSQSISYANAQATATRLRVEYLDSPLTIDVPTPRFTWALSHPTRGQYQTAYSITVNQVNPNGSLGPSTWSTGKVMSNVSLNVPYGGSALTSDTDYQWSITWYDSNNVASTPAIGTFSVALLNVNAWLLFMLVITKQQLVILIVPLLLLYHRILFVLVCIFLV